jgi:hypothetical protein
MLDRLGIDEFFIETFGYHDCDETEKKKEIDISKVKDRNYDHFIDKNSSVDFIFGEKKIFMIFTYKKDLQRKFSRIVYDAFEGRGDS